MKAYITGTDRGLGLALAQELLGKGWTVFAGAYGLGEGGLSQLQVRYSDRLIVVPLDAGSDASVAEAAAAIRAYTGELDMVINNAGILGDHQSTLTDELDFGDMLNVYNVNTLGPLRVVRSVYPLIVSGQLKRIVNISSEAGSMYQSRARNRKERYGYCMSKAALNIQSIMVQNHAGADGIKVYAVEPGWVRTYLRGEKNVSAKLEPEESAAKIITLVTEEEIKEELYLDLHGNRFEW